MEADEGVVLTVQGTEVFLFAWLTKTFWKWNLFIPSLVTQLDADSGEVKAS